MSSGAEITFGSLTLLQDLPGSGEYQIDVCADDTDWGNPEATVAAVASMLMDGERAQVTRYGNRMAKLNVRIVGATLDAVAVGTAALEGEVNKGGNTLMWLPPGWSTAGVFDVVYSIVDFKTDDLSETAHVTRYFTLTLACLPFPRRAELTTAVAAPVSTIVPTVTPIDDCTSLTGWSLGASGVVTAGAIVVTPFTTGISAGVGSADRAGLSVALAAGDFVRVELEVPNNQGVNFTINGASARIVATEFVGGGVTRWYLKAATQPTTMTSLGCYVTSMSGYTLKVRDVAKVNLLPYIGTGRQRAFTAPVGGTARTSADIVVEGTGPLGSDVLVFTAPADAAFTPPLRQWLTSSGGITTSSARISGAFNDFNGIDSVYRIPVSEMPPGMHLIMAAVRVSTGSSDVTFNWSTTITDHPYSTAGTDASGATVVPLTTTWSFRELGVAMLPPVAVDPTSDAVVQLTLGSASATAQVDEVWLLNLDTGVVSWLSGIDTGSPTKVEVRSAGLDRDRPSWVVGTAATHADDLDVPARAASPGQHVFAPGEMSIFLVTPGTESQTVDVEHYERFRHHVPPVAS